ncbi:uncharacterized protein LOC142355608 [Convolutriloba macropyga]|uniref:uncharacterized protein LOC142355608 n=1 Tax=Convolutriloba macropyga TaxID=536237 RepID=UPI003F52855E
MGKKRIIRLCSEPVDHGTMLHLLSMGSTSSENFEQPRVAMETAFTDSKFVYSFPWNIEVCPDENICTEPVTKGSRICLRDAGSPLYLKGCSYSSFETLNQCLMGVTSHYDNGVRRQSEEGNTELLLPGNYFTSVPYFHQWILQTTENLAD